MSEIEAFFNHSIQWFWGMIWVRDPGHRLYWFFLLCFFAVGSCVYLIKKPGNSSLVTFLLPKDVLTHRSTYTDLKIYLLNGVLGTLINIATLIASTALIASGVNSFLNSTLGILQEQFSSTFGIKVGFGIAFLLLTDFSVFFAHYLHHRIPYLWSFHKTHHSAEVLTPITAYRFHPIELILSGLILSLCVGPLVGIYEYLFDSNYFTSNPTVFGVAMLLWLLTANFRHSHIPLHYPRIVSRWLVSPAMHNI